MLNKNLTALRKARGLSQEELAARLGVVRQTVSKWERGYSVPDAELLIKLAEVLEVSVAELLGEGPVDTAPDASSVAAQLSRINEQLAIQNRRARRVWKTVLSVLLAALLITAALLLLYHLKSEHYEFAVNREPASSELYETE